MKPVEGPRGAASVSPARLSLNKSISHFMFKVNISYGPWCVFKSFLEWTLTTKSILVFKSCYPSSPRCFTVRHLYGHVSPTEDENMAASLRLGRQGILFGLRLSHFSKCSRARHPCQEHVRHFFQSPCFLGECWRFDGRAVCPLRLCGQPLTFANIIFNLESCH